MLIKPSIGTKHQREEESGDQGADIVCTVRMLEMIDLERALAVSEMRVISGISRPDQRADRDADQEEKSFVIVEVDEGEEQEEWLRDRLIRPSAIWVMTNACSRRSTDEA